MRRLLIAIIGLTLLASGLPAAAAPPQGDDKWALIIGIDTFVGRTRPNIGAVGDAAAFHELVRRDGFRDDRVRILTNEGATREAILQGLQWMVDNCSPTSYCLVHYSGHTKQMNGPEGLNEFLWPHDNRFIADHEFADYMRRLQGYAWVDVSACEAAGFDHGISSPRRLFTAASQEHEKAFEYPPWSMSVWTGTLVRKGMIEGHGDQDGDGHATLREAITYAAAYSARLTEDQTPSPQHPFIAGGEETEWFMPPPPVQAAAPALRCFLIFFCTPA